MIFVSLGLVNVRRNLSRSVLAIAGMAVASLVVTSLLSLAPSRHQGAQLAERYLFGGDIVLTGLQIISGAHDLDPQTTEPSGWRLERPPQDSAGLWGELVPWLWTHGSLSPRPGARRAGDCPAWLDGILLQDVLGRLAQNPQVLSARPVTIWPVLETPGGEGAQWTPRTGAFLLGRDPDLDRANWGQSLSTLLVQGRYLVEGDSLVGLVDSRRGIRGFTFAGAGATLNLAVPRGYAGPDGQPLFDYTDLRPLALPIAGVIETVVGSEVIEGEPIPVFWGTGAVLVPQAALDDLARERGLAAAPANAVVVRARSLIGLSDLVERIRAEFPGLRVASVQELLASLNLSGAPQPLMTAMDGQQLAAMIRPRALPLDLNVAFAVIAFTIAALIVASNLLVLLTQRRREIAILRALGAKSGDVAVMVLTETVLLSAMGCVLGYWPIRLLSTFTLISNRLSLGRIVTLTLGDFGVVVGLGLCLAVLFGLLPAVAATRVTCTEALRDDD
ncbi:MAG: FtsX-like permease family protein [Bacillota bacterium]|nr:FtsX-like permease family protein [Bacillota bacterium]